VQIKLVLTNFVRIFVIDHKELGFLMGVSLLNLVVEAEARARRPSRITILSF
jgi:hypothetical protein